MLHYPGRYPGLRDDAPMGRFVPARPVGTLAQDNGARTAISLPINPKKADDLVLEVCRSVTVPPSTKHQTKNVNSFP